MNTNTTNTNNTNGNSIRIICMNLYISIAAN